MRQVWIPRIGGPTVLEVREAPDPEAGPGEVRVRAEAAGVNFADIMARMGLYQDAPPVPCVVGYEVAGTVDQVGAGVEGLAPGDRVAAMTKFGGYTDVAVVPSEQVFPIPDRLDFVEAATIPVNYLTAWVMLVHLGNLHPGERVLVHAAAGGVGQAAIQICRWRGAEVIGTASPGKHPRLKDMGVDHCIDYTQLDFEEEVARITGGRGVHIVLDAIGGESFSKSYRSLSPMGRLFLFGVSSFAPGKKRSILAALKGLWNMPAFKSIPLINDNRGVHGINMYNLWSEIDVLGSMMGEITRLAGEEVLRPVVDKTFSFEDAGQAHAYIQERKNFGKVILTP